MVVEKGCLTARKNSTNFFANEKIFLKKVLSKIDLKKVRKIEILDAP